ncbi:hypothetical protein M2171_002429 [Bradyrhizobium japonicum USDA 38]|uniref:hypothetical protein n=1 Tax=Bradyrhizobium japonicum TaxID=375 RepID=UPI0003F9AC81|nr:hypothetical protein [Bradyrhizobium japonicum]MCS3893296.1 hypothetical protein [Bradyrhizobium japonicum USDA 38]MCS3945810.1 hypothetical protein [Bradyrhizobium japonicum]
MPIPEQKNFDTVRDVIEAHAKEVLVPPGMEGEFEELVRGVPVKFRVGDDGSIVQLLPTWRGRVVPKATDEQVETAWAAIVGPDIASTCYSAAVVREDICTAISVVLDDMAQKLKDPVVVHVNMLRGGIAMLSDAQVKHSTRTCSIMPPSTRRRTNVPGSAP